MIIYAFKSITGVQWLNGQPVMWQQAGAWPQGTNLLSPTGLMPQPLGHNWPVPIAALPIAGYDNRQVQEFTGHKSGAMVQSYSRKFERMKEGEKRQASSLLTSSGRNKLRRAGGSGDKASKVRVEMYEIMFIYFANSNTGLD